MFLIANLNILSDICNLFDDFFSNDADDGQ